MNLKRLNFSVSSARKGSRTCKWFFFDVNAWSVFVFFFPFPLFPFLFLTSLFLLSHAHTPQQRRSTACQLSAFNGRRSGGSARSKSKGNHLHALHFCLLTCSKLSLMMLMIIIVVMVVYSTVQLRTEIIMVLMMC